MADEAKSERAKGGAVEYHLLKQNEHGLYNRRVKLTPEELRELNVAELHKERLASLVKMQSQMVTRFEKLREYLGLPADWTPTKDFAQPVSKSSNTRLRLVKK